MKNLKIIALSLLLWSCGNNSSKENKETHEQHEEVTETTNIATFEDIDATVAAQFNQMVEHYIHLKNGMVASNSVEAKAGAKRMLDAIATIDTLKLTTEQKPVFNAQIGKIREDANHIIDNDDIDHQRGHLNSLSKSIYNLIKSFGSEKTLYYEFCPMANNNNGGHWISEIEEIKNPYFGDEMLNCGEVKETIK
ncbi:MAG: DUF3347 domain-containing protein [Bacteroidia bacterium]|nr:DUF3347 domain-containing protein [Bacteroidia bacterium]